MSPASAWLLLAILFVACLTPWARVLIDDVVRGLARVAHARAGAAELMVFVISAALGAIPSLLGAVPPPSTHDEFAYLLAADTFAHGRLTNPPHELWEYFETFHEIMRPTYMAKFPPGQGLALAAGMLLGHPLVGAWGTVALACAAVCWMLRGALPPRWALIGGMLAAAHPSVYWWGQIYWGGGVALLGGTVLGGAMLRALRRPRAQWGIVAGVGMGILALSRPFEGALISAIAMAIVFAWSVARGRIRLILARFVLPAALALAPFGAWMMYYNWRVTRSAVTMPYVVHARQYMSAPLLWWQRPPPRPQYRHANMAEFFQRVEFDEYDRQRGLRNFVAGVGHKFSEIVATSLAPPTLLVPLLALVPLPVIARTTDKRRWRGPPARRAVVVVALLTCAGFIVLHVLLTPWFRRQYTAPVAGLFFLLLGTGLWRLSRTRVGAALAAAVVVLQFAAVGWVVRQMSLVERPTGYARQQLVEQLKRTPGDDLVIVRYSPGPQLVFEWVFNDADIDASPVVFGRYVDEAGVRRLLEYYPHRRAWMLDVDGPHVSPPREIRR